MERIFHGCRRQIALHKAQTKLQNTMICFRGADNFYIGLKLAALESENINNFGGELFYMGLKQMLSGFNSSISFGCELFYIGLKQRLMGGKEKKV